MFSTVQQLASLVTSQASPAGDGGLMSSPIVMMAIMFAVLYFVLILPSQRDRKKHASMLDALKRNDEVVTSSGIFGTITDINDNIFTLEIAKNVKIRVLKSAISKKIDEAAPAKAEAKT